MREIFTLKSICKIMAVIAIVAVTSLTLHGQQQMSISSNPPLTPTTSTSTGSGISFNLHGYSSVNILGMTATATGTGGTTYELWYNVDSVNGSPNISTANGWVLHETGTATQGQIFMFANPLHIPLGETYGVYFRSVSNSVNYSSSSSPTIFEDLNLRLNVGNNVGYAGTHPTPTIHPRHYAGTIVYELDNRAADDAGVTAVSSPQPGFCAGTQNIEVEVRNFGTSVIDSVTIEWELDGMPQTPVYLTQSIDTFGGTGSNTATVFLTSHTFQSNQGVTLKAWTSNPNGNPDTVNINDTLLTVIHPSITGGTFTIGGANADFNDFTSAVNHLQHGICGPVVFDVEPGVYNEQIELGNIIGTSATNTITFTGAGASNTILTFAQNSSNDRYTVRFNGSKHVTFEDMTIQAQSTGTYGWAVHFTDDAGHITLRNNKIITDTTSTSTFYNAIVASTNNTSYTAGGNTVNNLWIEDNVIVGGYNTIRLNGAAATRLSNINITGNEIRNARHTGIYLLQVDQPFIHKNIIDGRLDGLTTGAGIWFATVPGPFTVTNNVITNQGYYGIYVSASAATTTNRSLIANNMIGGGFRNTGALGGGIRFLGTTNNIDVFYNSINVDFGNNSGIYISVTSVTNLDVQNNSFAYTGTGTGYAVRYQGSMNISNSDHNNYYSTGSNFVYVGTDYSDLNALQAGESTDFNSQVGDPDYTSATDLTLTSDHLAFAGSPIPGVTDDIFGNPRNPVAPTIGAEEYAPYPINLFMQEVLAPQESCNLTDNETIEVQFMNFGYDTLPQGTSIEMGYQVNFNTPVTETLILPHELGLAQSYKYTFSTPADFKASGVYNIKTWVTIAGDGDRNDDTIVGVIENIIIDQFPYSQDFQDWFVYQSNNSSCSPTGIAQLDAWRQEPWAGGVWNVNMGTTPTPNTGPSSDFLLEHAGGVYLYTEVGSNCHNSTIGINTPCIDVAPLTNPGLNFAYHMYGEDMGELHVDIVGDTGTHYSVWSMSGDQGNVWHHTAVDLGAYTTPGERFRIRFRSETGTGPRGNMAIDAIVLGELPEPMNLPDTIWGCGVVRINAGEPEFTYDWSTGGTRNIEAVTNSGTEETVQNVIVKKYNEHGMMSVAEVVVILEPGPYVNLGDDIIECQEVAVVLDAGNPGMNYLWNTGAVSQTITVSESGQYIASAIHSNGCIDTDTINVIIEHQPLAIITAESDTNSSVFHFSSAGSYGTSYLWDFGDGSGSTLQNPVHMYNRQGTFDVTLTVSTICGTTTTSYLASNINVGVGDMAHIGYFNIYPNPTSGTLNIDLKAQSAADFRIDIVDMQGSVVWNRDLSNSGTFSEMVDLSNLAKGVYFVRLTSAEGSTTQKLIIQ